MPGLLTEKHQMSILRGMMYNVIAFLLVFVIGACGTIKDTITEKKEEIKAELKSDLKDKINEKIDKL